MLRVCEKLREADAKGRRYGLARAETGYLRALVDAMADMDRLAEVELLKSLGDVNLEKGRLGKDVGKLNRALTLYMAAVVRCDHREQGESIEHRYEYTEMLLQAVSSKESSSENKGTPTPSKVAEKFQDLDKKWAAGGNTDSMIVGYAQLMVEGIVSRNNMLETEAVKSLGDVYLKRGTETGNTKDVTRATALYNTALSRCQNVQGTVAIVHRLLHTSKIRQDIGTIKIKRSARTQQHFSAAPSSDAMLRVCEKLREADAKGRRYGLARAETGYLRALVDAMADMGRLAEVELLKSLGDVNLEKGRLGKDVGKFNRALALYMAAVVRCDHREQGEGIEHRRRYTERLLQGASSNELHLQAKQRSTGDKETTTPAKLAEKFQDLDTKLAIGGDTDSVLVGYAQLMVEGIVNENSILETEAIKSLGDVYLKRGTIIRDTTYLTRAAALYHTAMARSHNVQGTVVIVHRLLYTAKIRQDITTTTSKRSARMQRQQDVRGRRGHFSHLSAVPSSNVIDDGKRHRQISYRRYIQTADRDLGNGDLDAAEQNLAAALKLVHDPSKPDKAKEADCLSRLGDVYVERGKWTGEGRTFTQAAALYNASMARTDGDRQNIVARLKETERQFLRNTCNLDCEPCPYSSALDHKKELKNMRARVKSQLDTIHQKHNPYQYDEDDPVVREVEIKRAEAIKNLFKSITVERQEFIQVLTEECIAKLGLPPCKYAFIGLGSQATELVTPYSDLEFAILIEEGRDDDDTRRYFLNLTHYLHPKVINLGETILPAMAIPSLNDFLSEDPEKDWFFDSVTPRGFAFDGFMPWASKTPFGRDKTKSKPSISLIQTPAKLAEYHYLHIAVAEGYHLSDILRRVSYLTGDESLVEEYTDRVNKTVDNFPLLGRLSATLSLMHNIPLFGNAGPTAQLLNVQKEIYRFPSVAVEILCLFFGITVSSVWQMTEELRKSQRISQKNAHHLKVLISISAELRLQTYIANGGQQESISLLNEMKTPKDNISLEAVFYVQDTKMLFRYYYTVIPLKRYINGTIARATGPISVLSSTPMFDNSSHTRGLISLQLFRSDASICHLEAALEEADGETDEHFEIMANLGCAWTQRGNYEKAKSYFEQSLRARGGASKVHPHVAGLLNNIGACWSRLGNQRKALSYHELSLKMIKAIYGDESLDIASSLMNIGGCWADLGDQRKAISYFEQSERIMKAIHGEATTHPDIASLLNNIGSTWCHLGDEGNAISYFEQSLVMVKAIYGANTAHPSMAGLLNNIGKCWSDRGEESKAIRNFDMSLNIMKVIYGDDTAHPDIASSLNNIGSCWDKLGHHRKAISYYESH
ncbi:uncharacterized protein [Branchiostoma lanceolatum]|uniref:uncharacterized protein n=1 Tax=Branchiostoma lanceolatum TaxID=7740 RepID=UPI0034567E76